MILMHIFTMMTASNFLKQKPNLFYMKNIVSSVHKWF